MPPDKRDIAMVFQSIALYPHMTVYQNISFPLRMARTPKAETDQRVRAAADLLRIGELLDRRPHQLSGGQRQRVALGRSVVRDPAVFLFDEPLSSLDAKLRVDMRVEVKKLHERLGATFVYVTHDQVEAMTMADRVAVMDGGVVLQLGPPDDIYTRPANLMVAGFLGNPGMNFVAGRLANGGSGLRFEGGNVAVALSDAAASAGASGQAVTLGIRPESVEVGDDPAQGATIHGNIFATEPVRLGPLPRHPVRGRGGRGITPLQGAGAARPQGAGRRADPPVPAPREHLPLRRCRSPDSPGLTPAARAGAHDRAPARRGLARGPAA